MEVNDNDQIVFLPLKFILDNMQKSIQWAKGLHQTSIFLKLGFSKAYDRIDRIFMFQVMEKLGTLNPFINTIRMLFQDMVVSVNINNQVT